MARVWRLRNDERPDHVRHHRGARRTNRRSGPRNQFTLWSTYDVTDRLGAGGGVVSQSKMYTSFTNQVELPAFTRVDAVAYYRFGRYRLGVNAENLFNATYHPTANGDNNISPGAPRNVQFSLRAMF